MYLDPVKATQQPREDLIRYLITTYALRDPHLRHGFRQLLETPGNIYQQPYLEGAQPYCKAQSIQALVEEGLLHSELLRLFTPADRPLYRHQERAVRAVVGDQRNIVVATGTGSGKTECFLIPMVNTLLEQPGTGVQALILYPMNALVNDQVKRLRQLLCHQSNDHTLIRFGFYTSRTETDPQKAEAALQEELAATERKELLKLLPEDQRARMEHRRTEDLVNLAMDRVKRVQAISRREIWDNPPQILVTNYSMLEHMLIRPVERTRIFERSPNFRVLVVDEAHTYSGSTGTEVAMLLKRFKVALGIENPGQIRCIATSATLGDRSEGSAESQITGFAQELFGEPFDEVIWGDRVPVSERLGETYALPDGLDEADLYEYLYDVEIPALAEPLPTWRDALSYLVPQQVLDAAEQQSEGDSHRFLWFALQGHPLVHRLIHLLSQGPKPWANLARSPQLWTLPTRLDGTLEPEEDRKVEPALARLVQLGTLARLHSEDLPLLPVRLHLLFRSLEGLYACINQNCSEVVVDPAFSEHPNRYGKLYLTSKDECESCQAPVLELASCRKCGQGYSLTSLEGKILQPVPRTLEAAENSGNIYVLSAGPLDSVTDDEGDELPDESDTEAVNDERVGRFLIQQRDGWLGQASRTAPTSPPSDGQTYTLHWHRPAKATNLNGGYLNQCPACGARRTQMPAVSRFISYTDAPLEVMLDSLFELLPEPDRGPSRRTQAQPNQFSRRKLLTFSDGRQDAAFFASDFQRTHTETLYRQAVWQAFQSAQRDGTATVSSVAEAVVDLFLERSIPHPDREEKHHHRSYVVRDEVEDTRNSPADCQSRAEKRAKELMLREFGLPSAKRFSLEALGLLACHINWDGDDNLAFVEEVVTRFKLNTDEAILFLTGLTDIIRLLGAVDLDGASQYFPETGGVDGGQPPRLTTAGRSKRYIKLRRSSSDAKNPNAIGFLWRINKDGQPTQRQNQIVSFYRNFFNGHYPAETDVKWLLEELRAEAYLTDFEDSYQLNWGLFSLSETQTDWHQCDTCQQIFHLPGLDALRLTSKQAVDHCLAAGCGGTLSPWNRSKFDNHHYRHIIQNRELLPLRSQEHTAQLGTGELAHRESRFRQGYINLLSCSTTLEMGVDIGELQSVAMRNFPPHVSNYQQRAGRAGRRTDGVAISLMYGQRRPHDRYYFEQPAELINGRNQVPKLDIKNFQIQQRHLRAELLAQFLRDFYQTGAEKVKIGQFLGFPDETSRKAFQEIKEPPSDALLVQFLDWLGTDEAIHLLEQWLRRLDSPQTVEQTLQEFRSELDRFKREQFQDWNNLAILLSEVNGDLSDTTLDRKIRRAREVSRDRLEDELRKIQERQLHEELAKASILPIYGFPIDVVQLLTRSSDQYSHGSQGRHRLQRDRRMALSEYAPGQEVVVDDRVHTSVGVPRPQALEEKHYWVCPHCNYFESQSGEFQRPQCPTCQKPIPGVMNRGSRLYKVPKSFTTDWDKIPKVTPYLKPKRQPTSQVFLAQEGEHLDAISQDLYSLRISRGGQFFLANQGGRNFNNLGFALCERCGKDLSDSLSDSNLKSKSKSKSKPESKPRFNHRRGPLPEHTHPITGRICSGWFQKVHLGHEFRSDLLKIQFAPQGNLLPLYEPVVHLNSGDIIQSDHHESQTKSPPKGPSFWRSLTYALLAAAAQVIDVPRSELDGLFRPLDGNQTGRAEIVMYDNVPGGAGYSQRIAEQFPEVLRRAYQLVASCSCGSSCYDCLRTYTNQVFHHDLDRHSVANFLQQIVEQTSPDDALRSFAPDAIRLSLTVVNRQLSSYAATASPTTGIYLPEISSPVNLLLLTKFVRALAAHNTPLTLIVHKLPTLSRENSHGQLLKDEIRVLRKRLFQWIDQGSLTLYQTELQSHPTLCISSRSANRVALQLRRSDNGEPQEWFQTRSDRGVDTVVQFMDNLQNQSKLVLMKELDDPQIQLISPEPNWGAMNLEELQSRLGIKDVLTYDRIAKVRYSDRYLSKEGAQILARILSLGMTDLFPVSVEFQELYEDYQRRSTQRRSDIEKALQNHFDDVKVTMRQYNRRYSSPSVSHRRELTITYQSRSKCRVLLDKGMDFLRQVEPGVYEVTEETYLVIDASI